MTIHGGAVTAENLLFFDADRGGWKLDLHMRIILREQQYSPSRSGER
jgi:hypothetical protein